MNLAWIACIGAMLHMIVAGVKDIEPVIEHVEWSTLMFFAALFIMMRALDRLGLIQYFGLQVSNWISQVPPEGRLAAAVTVVLWISGIGSAFVDNIPITGALIPVVVQLSSAPLNLPGKCKTEGKWIFFFFLLRKTKLVLLFGLLHLELVLGEMGLW